MKSHTIRQTTGLIVLCAMIGAAAHSGAAESYSSDNEICNASVIDKARIVKEREPSSILKAEFGYFAYCTHTGMKIELACLPNKNEPRKTKTENSQECKQIAAKLATPKVSASEGDGCTTSYTPQQADQSLCRQKVEALRSAGVPGTIDIGSYGHLKFCHPSGLVVSAYCDGIGDNPVMTQKFEDYCSWKWTTGGVRLGR